MRPSGSRVQCLPPLPIALLEGSGPCTAHTEGQELGCSSLKGACTETTWMLFLYERCLLCPTYLFNHLFISVRAHTCLFYTLCYDQPAIGGRGCQESERWTMIFTFFEGMKMGSLGTHRSPQPWSPGVGWCWPRNHLLLSVNLPNVSLQGLLPLPTPSPYTHLSHQRAQPCVTPVVLNK